MAPNILLLLPMRRGLSPLPLNLGGFVSASTSGELPRLGYIGHALHLVLVQHFLSRHSFWMILHGTQTCCEKPMPTEWPCEGDVDNSSSWAQLWSHPSSGAQTERSLQMIAASSSSSLLSWAPDTVEQQQAFPLSAVQTLPTELGSIIKGLLFYTIKLRVVCYTTWRTRIASF